MLLICVWLIKRSCDFYCTHFAYSATQTEQHSRYSNKWLWLHGTSDISWCRWVRDDLCVRPLCPIIGRATENQALQHRLVRDYSQNPINLNNAWYRFESNPHRNKCACYYYIADMYISCPLSIITGYWYRCMNWHQADTMSQFRIEFHEQLVAGLDSRHKIKEEKKNFHSTYSYFSLHACVFTSVSCFNRNNQQW